MRIVMALLIGFGLAGTLPARAQLILSSPPEGRSPPAGAPVQEPPPQAAPVEMQPPQAMPAQDLPAGKRQDRAAREPAPPPGRFNFLRVDDSFVRLDNKTGQVAYCTAGAGGWTCSAVPEERAALEKEIARLQDEVAALKRELAAQQQAIAAQKKQIADVREPPPPVPPLPVPPPTAKNDEFRRNIAEDFARARDYLQWTWRQLVGMIVKLQKDVTGNG
jgi:hypothetical protein